MLPSFGHLFAAIYRLMMRRGWFVQKGTDYKIGDGVCYHPDAPDVVVLLQMPAEALMVGSGSNLSCSFGGA